LLDGIYVVTTKFKDGTLSYATGLDARKKSILEILGPESVSPYDRPTTMGREAPSKSH
jgi:hypothetical protein